MGFGNERNAVSDAIDHALDGHSSDDLLGDCPYNARRLYDELQERDVHCHIVRGACEKMGEPTPETITEAEDLGLVHWWVEARVDGTWMTVDLASEWTPHLGETLYQSNRPEPYIPFIINPEHSEDFAKR